MICSVLLLNVYQKFVLGKLRTAEGAGYDSHANEHDAVCHPGTRVDLLAEIYEWADNADGKCIYWLQGMAGTGKSTISRTVAHNLARRGSLGASFFFKRGEGDRGTAARFFTTIAAQLVHKRPRLAQHVQNAIEANHSIAETAMKEQFEKLVLQPLKKVEAAPIPPETIVVVVDALDECGREEDAQTIIGLLPEVKQLTSVRLKFFVTSRPEFPIRSQFDEISGTYQDLVLQDVPNSIIEHDISEFLAYKLAKVRDAYNRATCQLPSDWPGQTKLQILAKMAIPLFIFAATSCRFIEDKRYGGGGPDGRLEKILEYRASGHTTTLNEMYLLVLATSVREEAMDEFRDIVGSITILASPFSRAGLALLLGIPKINVNDRLDLLHSVLRIPADQDAPIRLLHLSFQDFLINRDNHKSDRFWIDKEKTHENLATRCLHLLMNNDYLKKDICGLQMPGRLRDDIDRQKIDGCLPSGVQYACLYWVYHLKGSRIKLHDEHRAFQFLQRHFLHWLEALSLIGRISESVGLIDELQRLVDVSRFQSHAPAIY